MPRRSEGREMTLMSLYHKPFQCQVESSGAAERFVCMGKGWSVGERRSRPHNSIFSSGTFRWLTPRRAG